MILAIYCSLLLSAHFIKAPLELQLEILADTLVSFLCDKVAVDDAVETTIAIQDIVCHD